MTLTPVESTLPELELRLIKSNTLGHMLNMFHSHWLGFWHAFALIKLHCSVDQPVGKRVCWRVLEYWPCGRLVISVD